ncbi:MAG TPA: PIG-L family deacetylase [Candidatus Nitrosotalea sp.]|jgi:LmbE family N-acetylglucosaminyl deacetylase|nr:PIG-L family deacetylase [Candidatus Nitrosotalea sp.]
MNILAIGAHPDDIELGCGGLLIKSARQGHNVYMYSLTRGGAGGDSKQRSEELARSARFIKAKQLWIDNFEDSKLTVTNDLINHIEFFIHKANPDLILTHSHGDVHHDHRAIALATLEAARFNSNVLSYEIPLSRNFDPKVFVDISEVVNEKVELIEIFWSQQSKLYLKANAIKGLAEYRALQSRLNTSIKYVEAFEVMKICLTNDFKLLTVPYEKVTNEKAVANLDEILELA